MNKEQAIKWMGLLGSVLTAGVLVSTGSTTEAIGVIFAALSSAGVLKGS